VRDDDIKKNIVKPAVILLSALSIQNYGPVMRLFCIIFKLQEENQIVDQVVTAGFL